VREGRARLVEALADHHDSVLVEQVVERHLLEGAVPTEDLVAALREATLANHLLPAYAGSALRNRGVQPLMDGIVQLLPCPLDCPPQVGVHPKTGEEESRPPKPSAPFSALAFKTVSEPSVDLTFIRVYSGSVKGRVQVLNATRNKTERIGPIYYRMHGRHRSEVRELMPGSIAVLAGLRFTSTGDTLCAVERPLVYETITFPETVLAMTIEPSSAAGRGKLVDALSRLARDDPTFRVGEDPETGEMVIGGMGELHLEIIKHRLLRDFNVEARVGQPRVSYRESVRLTGRGRHEHEQIVGDRRRYFARVELELAPDPGTRAVRVAFAASLEEQLPRAMRDVLVETIQGCAGGGVQLGYPFIDLHVEVREASSEGADSSEAAYAAAAAGAFSEACEALGQVGGLAILEPLMELEVLVPEAYLGNVINDLNGRRALVTEMGGDQDMRVVRGKVPLREMFNYTTDLRSMTHGKATHVMEPLEYAPLPEELQRQLLGIG
jgi:elongation factor G